MTSAVGHKYRLNAGETTLEGEVVSSDHKGYFVRMISPYPGLTLFVPSLTDRRPELSLNEKIGAALVLVQRKAQYYLRNRDRIESRYRDRLRKLSGRANDRSTKGAFHRYETARSRINRAHTQGMISDEARRQRIGAERRRLVDRLELHSRERRQFERTVLENVVTVDDVESLSAHFSRH
jgi:hypothetical protein